MPRKSTIVNLVCEQCGKSFQKEITSRNPTRNRFCSFKCKNGKQVIPLLERIRRRLSSPNERGCIIWPGATNGDGRAIIKSEPARKVMVLVSRTLYEATSGPIPEGLGVLHRCDNPRCVNIEHFFLGTQAVNMTDCCIKGRKGNKLTVETVRSIRNDYAEGKATCVELAIKHQVAYSGIRKIVNRETWKYA